MTDALDVAGTACPASGNSPAKILVVAALAAGGVPCL
jgi:hypothetical protein